MKVLLDIQDVKAPFVIELLNNLPFVKTRELLPNSAKILEDVKEAAEEVNLITAGKLKARNAEDLFDKF